MEMVLRLDFDRWKLEMVLVGRCWGILALEWGFRGALRCPFGVSVHRFRPHFRFQMTAD